MQQDHPDLLGPPGDSPVHQTGSSSSSSSSSSSDSSNSNKTNVDSLSVSLSDLRLEALNTLGLRCIFPASIVTGEITHSHADQLKEIDARGLRYRYHAARSMLEATSDEKLAFDSALEDVVIRLVERSDEIEKFGSSITSVQIIENIIQDLYSRIPKYIDDSNNKINKTLHLDFKLQKKFLSNALHPNLSSLYFYIESDRQSFILHEYSKHTMLTLSRFYAKTTLCSPTLGRKAGIGSKDLRLRFIIYQLFQAMAFIHSKDLVLNELGPGNIMLDDLMWLSIPISISRRTCIASAINLCAKRNDIDVNEALMMEFLNPSHNSSNNNNNNGNSNSSNSSNSDSNSVNDSSRNRRGVNHHHHKHHQHSSSSVPVGVDHRESLTSRWVNKKISNFEYLMAVNTAAGRSMIDPLYHPILPWVTDFVHEYTENSELDDGTGLLNSHNHNYLTLRDLTKTMFRLRKGDAQLETTYKHSDPPHHIPESLSELTYYIYMARRTPLQVLRRVVRDVFVPEHYPHSMARMYDWTPDECIPEFYTDTSVFASLHPNLSFPDLELPSFASTPDEFIKYHRRVLESDEVSTDLNHWLNLTFGYCLEGKLAIENMNVPLKQTLSISERLGDSPNLDKHPGFIMLFSKPHPRRITKYSYVDRRPTRSTSDDFVPKKSYSQLQQQAHTSALLNKIVENKADEVSDLIMKHDLISFIDLNLDMNINSSKTKDIHDKSLGLEIQALSQVFNVNIEKSSRSKSHKSGGSGGIGGSSSGGGSGGGDDGQAHVHKYSLDFDEKSAKYSKVLKAADDIDLSLDRKFRRDVEGLENEVELHEFSHEFGSFLQPCYKIEYDAVLSEKSRSNSGHYSYLWDEELEECLESNYFSKVNKRQRDKKQAVASYSSSSSSSSNGGSGNESEIKSKIKSMQSEDIFSIGCIIAEIYLGKPLLSEIDCHTIKTNPKSIIPMIIKRVAGLPIVIRKLILILVQADPEARPTFEDVLQACSFGDYDLWQKKDMGTLRSGGLETGFVKFHPDVDVDEGEVGVGVGGGGGEGNSGGGGSGESSNLDGKREKVAEKSTSSKLDSSSKSSKFDFLGGSKFLSTYFSNIESSVILDLLEQFCGTLFPQYFKSVYSFIGRIKLCRHGLDRFRVIFNSLSELSTMPIEGLGLVLPHILACLSDPSHFRTNAVPVSTSTNSAFSASVSTGVSGGVGVTSAYSSAAASSTSLPSTSGAPSATTATAPPPPQPAAENVTIDPATNPTSERANDIIFHYASVIDVIGSRLGVEITDKIVIPRVLEFMNKLNSPKLLQVLLSSNFCSIVIIRAGVKSFLRNFLPLLLTYLVSGTLQNISRGIGYNENGVSPLWTSMSIPDKTEWLHLCSESGIKEVQHQAVLCFSYLVESGALGPGICSRYIIPTLMSLIGIPPFAAASLHVAISDQEQIDFDNLVREAYPIMSAVLEKKLSYRSSSSSSSGSLEKLADINGPRDAMLERDRPEESDLALRDSMLVEIDTKKFDALDDMINNIVQNSNAEMCVVRALIAMSIKLGELVTSELIVVKIFDDILPRLEMNFYPTPDPSTVSALTEVILLLNGIFPFVTESFICKYYLQPNKPKSYSLLKLLYTLPLIPSYSIVDDCIEGKKVASLGEYIHRGRYLALLNQLIKMVVSTSMFVGASKCVELVLPSVDRFFERFIDSFQHLPIESKTMMQGFELGAELFIPLTKVTGEANFTTHVPHLNPKLEMWLMAMGGRAGSKKSPPLPSNFVPDLQMPSDKEEKKKGFFNSLFSKSKKPSSSTLPSSGSSGSSSSVSSSSSFSSSATSKHYSTPVGSTQTSIYNSSSGGSSSSARLSSLGGSRSSIGNNVNNNNATTTTSPHDLNTSDLSPVAAMQVTSAIKAVNARTPSLIASPRVIGSATSASSQVLSPTDGMELKVVVTSTSNNEVGTPYRHTNSIANELSSTPLGGSGDSSGSGDNLSPRDLVSFVDASSSISGGEHTANAYRVSSDGNELSDGSTSKNDTLNDVSDSDDDDDFDRPSTTNAPSSAGLLSNKIGSPLAHSSSLEKENSFGSAVITSNKSFISSNQGDSSPSRNRDGSLIRQGASAQNANVQIIYPSDFVRNLLADNISSTSSQKIVQSSLPGYSSAKSKVAASKVGMLKGGRGGDVEDDEEEEARERHYHEMQWLMGGNGKWNSDRQADQRMKDNQSALGETAVKRDMPSYNGRSSANQDLSFYGNQSYSKQKYFLPSGSMVAQVSMTAPRISVDIASETSAFFTWKCESQTQWRVEEQSGKADQDLSITTLIANANESLLLSCSKSGVKLWSLNSHPTKAVSFFNKSTSTPFCANFMRSGIHVATCDGAINIWDVERRQAICFINQPSQQFPFTYMTTLASRHGLTPAIGPFGDDQLLLCSGESLQHYDFRCNAMNPAKCISEWRFPLRDTEDGKVSWSSGVEDTSLTVAAAHDKYVLVGSSSGGLFCVDRRQGKVLHSWQGHDSAVLKIFPLDEKTFVSVSDKSAHVWSCIGNEEPRKMSTVKQLIGPSSAQLYANSILMNTYDQPSNNGNNGFYYSNHHSHHQDLPVNSMHVMYCMAGHKMYGWKVPKNLDDGNRTNLVLGSSGKEFSEPEEIKVHPEHFFDRNQSKLPKQKLQIRSAAMLPMRRLLLLGTDDGLIRVVS